VRSASFVSGNLQRVVVLDLVYLDLYRLDYDTKVFAGGVCLSDLALVSGSEFDSFHLQLV